jgi:hypothetical protein
MLRCREDFSWLAYNNAEQAKFVSESQDVRGYITSFALSQRIEQSTKFGCGGREYLYLATTSGFGD